MRVSRIGSSSPIGGVIRVKGVTQVLARLDREIAKIQGLTQEGLIRATAKIHEETEKGSVKTPRDLGNLRHSWFYVTANARIVAGGNTGKLVSTETGSFIGPKAGEFASQHSSIKGEMVGKAKALSNVYKGPFIIMGYSMNYALWVHEMVGAHFSAEGTGAKWFQIAIENQKDNILKILRDTARIK